MPRQLSTRTQTTARSELTEVANEKAAAAAGSTYIAATVFGRPDAAQSGTLIQVLAGPAEQKKTVRPIVEAWSRAVLDVGEEVYKGESPSPRPSRR